MRPLCPEKLSPRPAALAASRHPVGQGFAGQAEHRALGERLFGPVRLNLAQGVGEWFEGTLSLKVPISGVSANSGRMVTGSCRE